MPLTGYQLSLWNKLSYKFFVGFSGGLGKLPDA